MPPLSEKPQQPAKKPAPQAVPVSPSPQQKKPPPVQPTTIKARNIFKKIDEAVMGLFPIPLAEKLFFAANLRVMIKAGLSITDALETLAMQTKNKHFAKILRDIKAGVTKGNALASQLKKYPKIFPAFFVNMVAVGEKSGTLDANLEQLALQMKKDHDLTSKVRGAMIYPSVILAATVGIVILMFVYVIPSVLSIFEELELELPLATKILIAISRAITDHGLLVGIVAVTSICGFVAYSRTKKGKRIFHFVFLRLWIIGPIVKKVNLARFSRTISSLLKTDIPVIQSFKITSTVLGNVYYKNACHRVSEQLAKGIAINTILRKEPKLFPPLVTQMTLVGEKSGTLDTLLSELAIFYENEVSDITKNLSSIIEPILIIFLGGIVGLIAFAVISPIYTMSQGLD